MDSNTNKNNKKDKMEMLSEEELVGKLADFYKENPNDKVWWTYKIGFRGEILFSFDKKKVYNLFEDYPQNLTKEEKEIFDKENPFWVKFFNEQKH